MTASAAEHPEPGPDGPGPLLAEWIGRHQAYVWRYARYLGADPSLAEDVAQDTFVAALAHRVHERPEPVGQAWLRTTARNFYLAHQRCVRVRGQQRRLEDLDAAFEVHAHPDLGESYSAALDRCLQQLDGRGREVLRLRYAEGSSREEMSAALGLSPEGVKTLLRRVKKQLRRCIEKRRNT